MTILNQTNSDLKYEAVKIIKDLARITAICLQKCAARLKRAKKTSKNYKELAELYQKLNG